MLTHLHPGVEQALLQHSTQYLLLRGALRRAAGSASAGICTGGTTAGAPLHFHCSRCLCMPLRLLLLQLLLLLEGS